MARYRKALIKKVQELRSLGKTYGEIRREISKPLPKSTLSYWCRDVSLPPHYSEKLAKLNATGLSRGRAIAVEVNRIRRVQYLRGLDEANLSFAEAISDPKVAKIALALLCLGEASKSKTGSSFCLGSSDPRIVIIFLRLLRECFDFNFEKVRCTVQCRADQDTAELENYWMRVTGIPRRLFYKTRIDPRTLGKPTKRLHYKGVLKIDYLDTRIQLDLESLADLVYKQLANKGP